MTVATAVIAAVYEWHRAAQMERQLQELREKQVSSIAELEQMRRERDEMSNRLTVLADENAALKDDAVQLSRLRDEVTQWNAAVQTDPTQAAVKLWLERVNQLKQRMEQTPGAKIPELKSATEQDWLYAAKRELNTDADYRRALSVARDAAQSRVASQFAKAVRAYLRRNNDQFPTSLDQLQPYFGVPVDDSILQRWAILPANAVPGIRLGGDVVITQRAPVDDVFDTRYVVGQTGGLGSIDFFWGENGETMKSVYEAYGATHDGQMPDDPSQLEPYVTTSEQRAALEKLLLRQSVSK